MQIRKLKTVLEHIPDGMSMSTYAILYSYLSYEKVIKDENKKITFIDLLIYLNDNGFTIIPDLDILHKSDEELFNELIKGITRKKFEIQIRTENLQFILKKYQYKIEGWCEVFPHSVSPLHFAVSCNDYLFAKLLVDSNADVNMRAIFGCILESAIRYSDERMVRLLLENGADIHNDPFKPMETAIENKNSKHGQNILKLLQESESYSFKELKSPLVDKIDLGTYKCLPTDIVNIIVSYDPRSLRRGYFKVSTENNEKKIHNENSVASSIWSISHNAI